jgi:hypothetical protein
MALLCGRAGRLTVQNGGFRPGAVLGAPSIPEEAALQTLAARVTARAAASPPRLERSPPPPLRRSLPASSAPWKQPGGDSPALYIPQVRSHPAGRPPAHGLPFRSHARPSSPSSPGQVRLGLGYIAVSKKRGTDSLS